MNVAIEVYKTLQILDHVYNGQVAKYLNDNGHATLTGCPHCLIDDFTHVEGCELTPGDFEAQEVNEKKAFQCLGEFYDQVRDTGKMVISKDCIYYIVITEILGK